MGGAVTVVVVLGNVVVIVLVLRERMHSAILAQFRSGILPLRIETGRWKNENIEDRVCMVCEENIV